ncbi:MAG TPA: glycosyltransferase family 2 protein [Candidatus Sulfotelmatobacter sp.]|nr:glycosyltransferase family 2 protein [Candidatus Sulfotelmatobacter sp.]
MKLVIMIPCLNEETTLPLVLESIPKKIAGVDSQEILIIDDGCTDKTVEVARSYGVRHFIHHAKNRGLAYSLRDGIRGALEMGADILVLTDGDHQYPQERIPDLIKPILDGKADTVIGDRQTHTIEHFSPMKKFLQKLGTKVLNTAAGTNIPDSTSGFRAYSKEAAIKMNLVGRFNFALETTFQASHKRLNFVTIKIKTNPKTRESRLFKSSWEHVRKSAVALTNAYTMYKPFVVFMTIGIILLICGLIPFAHYLYVVVINSHPYGTHHLQALIIGTVLLNASFISFTLGVVANLIRVNRVLIEDVLEEVRRDRYDMTVHEIKPD